MPKKNKKPSKNGFMNFMFEFKETQNKTFHNNEELAAAAGRRWEKMSKEERQPYENIASLKRNNMSRGNLNSQGREIAEIQRENEEKQQLIERMKNDINNTIRGASKSETLQDEMFFIIHINNLVYHPLSDKHYLCEIAIVGFTLLDGVQESNIFHRHIKPGKLPLGYYGDALQHSKETHQLIDIVYNDNDGEVADNNEQVFHDMINFLRKTTGKRDLPPLYSDFNRMDLCNKALKSWCEEFNFNEPIKIYNLQYMFYVLRNAVAGSIVWPSDTFSFQQLEKDVYSHNNNATCEYHCEIEQPIYCSRSIVVRSVYVICDNCCADLNIKLVLGCHIPASVKINPQRLVDGRGKPQTICKPSAARRVKQSVEEQHSDFVEMVEPEAGLSNKFRSLNLKENNPPEANTNLNNQFRAMSLNDRCYAAAVDKKNVHTTGSEDFSEDFPEPHWKVKNYSQ